MIRGTRGPAASIIWAALVAALAVLAGCLLVVTGAAQRLEDDTVDWRFQIRPTEVPDDVAVVAIDDVTFSRLGESWPFPRSLHADAIDRLTDAGAELTVYDIQFTEPTDPDEDLALYDAVARSGRVVLATTEVGEDGSTNVLGGDENLAAADAEAAASNLLTGDGEIVRRFPHDVGGLKSLAVASAERITGRELPPARFGSEGAWIDYRGPASTVPTSSFADLLDGRVPDATFRGKTVVVGATAPTLQDVHATPMADSSPMAGAEVQANAIWTALHGLPLRSAPLWMTALAIVLLSVIPPLVGFLRRPALLGAAVLAVAGAYAGLALLLFQAGLIIAVVAPLASLVVATGGTLVGGTMLEARLRRREERRAAELEAAVLARTSELREAQREILERLGRAGEWREEETGRHVVRVGRLCQALARALGMSEREAETIRLASALHDLGKIAVPDRVLLHDGPLDDEGLAIIREHTTVGGDILAGSPSELVQVAEQIARTHHERFDGAGYPDGTAGEDIPLAGRICAVCDVFDALCSSRSYKDSWTLEAAMAEIQASSGSHFDPLVVDAFLPLASTLYNDLDYAAPTARADTRSML